MHAGGLTPGLPRVKLDESKALRAQALHQDGGDKKACNHEEDVHPDEPAGESAGKSMKAQDSEHRDSGQPVYVSSIAQAWWRGHTRLQYKLK
jgi:hypothetical protein